MTSSRLCPNGVLIHYSRRCDWCDTKFREVEGKTVTEDGFHFCSKPCLKKMFKYRNPGVEK